MTKSRNLSNRANDFDSVRDFGAKGDGVTDDTAAIQAALTANANGTLLIPIGVYIISASLALPTAIRLVGEGYGSIIRAKSGWAPSIPTFSGGTYTPVPAHAPMLYNPTGIQWFEIDSITFDGNSQNCYGIYLNENFYGRLKDVYVLYTNYRPYTNIRGQMILNDNCAFYQCGDGVLTYDCTNLKFLSCGFEQLKGAWYYDHWQPNNKGQVTLDTCWFEDSGVWTPTSGYCRLDGRGPVAKIHTTLAATYVAQQALATHASADTQTVDGVSMTSQGAGFGELWLNNVNNTMGVTIGSGGVNNKVAGYYTATAVTDNGTATTWDYSTYSVVGQGVSAPFIVRTPASAGLPIGGSNYIMYADYNGGSPLVKLFGNANHALVLNSGIFQIKSNNSIQLNAAGAVNNADVLCTGNTGCFYPPSLTTTQRDAITGVVNGAIIFNSSLQKFQGREAAAWVNLV